MFKYDDYSKRVIELKDTTKLLNFRFPNKLLIRSGIGATLLKDERKIVDTECDEFGHTYSVMKEPRLIRVHFCEASSNRDYYLQLVKAAKKLGLYSKEIDDVLQDIADYRWSNHK